MRNVKFFATLARTCNGILWRHPRFTVNNRRMDVAPIELFIDSRRLEFPVKLPCNVLFVIVPLTMLNAVAVDELAVAEI